MIFLHFSSAVGSVVFVLYGHFGLWRWWSVYWTSSLNRCSFLSHSYVLLSCHVLICDHWLTLVAKTANLNCIVCGFYVSEQERDRLEFKKYLDGQGGLRFDYCVCGAYR